MASNYGFSVKSKVTSGPAFKYFVARFNGDEDALAFATWLNDELANNGKLSVRRILNNVQENDYEIPAGTDLTDEVQAMYRLDSIDQQGGIRAQSYLTIPSLTPRTAQDLPAFLADCGMKIKGQNNVDEPVTNVSLVRMTYYVV